MPSRTQELYIYDKVTLKEEVFGEFENNFSASLVLDRSRDSTKVIVKNYNSNVVLPNTICYMPTLNLWWIVASDKATRHAGGLYEHELQLLGAIEIFAHRDMINCGFNKDRYTLGSFLTRLASFIDFELPISFDYTYYDQNKRIEYIKSFDNFTPLSAIKEMLNGINAVPKMSFATIEEEEGVIVLDRAIIQIVPKTGINNEPIDISEFDDDKEVKTIDRNSYGSSVISNAQNCVCGQTIRYPLDGGVTYGTINGGKDEWENTVIKLPSNAEYVEELIMGCNGVTYRINGGTRTFVDADTLSSRGLQKIFNAIFIANGSSSQIGYFSQEEEDILKMLEQECNLHMTNGYVIDEFESQWEHPLGDIYEKAYFDEILNKDLKDYPDNCIYWEQGSNLIKNFVWLGKWTSQSSRAFGFARNSFKDFIGDLSTFPSGDFKTIYDKHGFKVEVIIQGGFGGYFVNPPLFAVKYRPQVDTKIKFDNDITGKDTNIYNQNGKLVDSQALAKLISSHASEIKSEEITRFKTYKSFANVPMVGSVVDNNGTRYIVNNLSLDFHELEDDYYINATITLTREVACKSTMVSDNKNIRDYDCPQNYNINREQVYRDYYEFDYDYLPSSINASFYNDTIDKVCRFRTKSHLLNNYVMPIRITLGHAGDPNNELYFKLETVRVNLCKSFVVIADFGDNNIIGFTKAKTNVPVFNIVQMFLSNELYTYPISYVDSIGEFKSISVALCNQNQFNSLITSYLEDIGEDYTKQRFFQYQPMIPNTMWEQIASNTTGDNKKCDLFITESDYRKDGLEKPKFEFITQFGNNNGIVVGNDFLEEETCSENEVLIYYWKEQDHIINEDNVVFEDTTIHRPLYEVVDIDNAVTISPYNATVSVGQVVKALGISFYQNASYHYKNNVVDYSSPNSTNLKGKNIALCMMKYDPNVGVIKQKFLLGINNIKIDTTSSLALYINSWKLK